MPDRVIFAAAVAGSRFPTTRTQGRTRRSELEDAVTGLAGVTLTIDFTAVDAMTISYADEFLARFLAGFDAGASNVVLVIRGLNPENLEAVEIALERRNIQVAMERSDGRLSLVGDQRLADTFKAAVALGSFGASELARELRISPQNANNRLKPLVESGALRKVRLTGAGRGGKEFLYSVMGADPTARKAESA